MVKRILALIIIMFTVPILIGGLGSPRPEADFVFSITSEHNSRDPQRMTYLMDIQLTRAMFEPLVILDFSNMETYPGMAESWEVSEDGLTYTFHLREDAKWSNGDPVTSHDFVYAWRRAMLPDTAAGYGHFMFFIKGAEDFFHWRNDQLAAYTSKYGLTDESGEEDIEAAMKKDYDLEDEPKSIGSESEVREMWAEAEKKFDEIVGLSTPDDRTLIIELNQRTEYFIDMLAFATYLPVHAKSVSAAVLFNTDTGQLLDDPTYWNDPKRLICNGAYTLKDRKYRQYNYLEANEYYWNRESLKNNSVMELIVNNEQSQLLLYETGVIDYVPSVIPDIAFDLIRQNRNDVHVTPMAGTYFYNLNCLPKLDKDQDNPLYDARVRRALAMAVNRDEITHSITRLNEPSAYTFVPPTALNFYHPPVEDGPRYDPEAARALLAEAGHANGKGISGLSILYNTGSGHENVAQAIKKMWKEELGVDVTLEGVESKISASRARSQDYTIRRTGWYGDYADPTTWLDIRRGDDENNTTKWKNDEYDRLLDEASLAKDPQKRLDLMRQAESILVKESPMVLIYHPVQVGLYKPEQVKGLALNGWSQIRFELISVDRNAGKKD